MTFEEFVFCLYMIGYASTGIFFLAEILYPERKKGISNENSKTELDVYDKT